MSLLNKAKDTAVKAAPSKVSKGTVWRTDSNAKDKSEAESLSLSVTELVRLNGELEARKTQMGAHKNRLLSFANSLYVKWFVNRGASPETPMKVVADSGTSVTYVVQNKCASSKVGDEQYNQLIDVVGGEVAARMVEDVTVIKLNDELLENPAIFKIVNDALERAVKKMVDGGLVSQEVAETIVQAESLRRFKPSTLDLLLEYSGRDISRAEDLLDVMGSAVVRYVKA